MAIDYAWKSDANRAYAKNARIDKDLQQDIKRGDDMLATFISAADVGSDIYEDHKDKKVLDQYAADNNFHYNKETKSYTGYFKDEKQFVELTPSEMSSIRDQDSISSTLDIKNLTLDQDKNVRDMYKFNLSPDLSGDLGREMRTKWNQIFNPIDQESLSDKFDFTLASPDAIDDFVQDERLANMGRYGDELIAEVDGEKAHVNTLEKRLIENYGDVGEEMVKEMGSGTINPYTGLKEYNVSMDPTAMIQLFLTVGNQMATAQKTDDANKDKRENLRGAVEDIGVKRKKINEDFYESLNRVSESAVDTLDQSLSQTGSVIDSSIVGDNKMIKSQKGLSTGATDIATDRKLSTIQDKFEADKFSLLKNVDNQTQGLTEQHRNTIYDIEAQIKSMNEEANQIDADTGLLGWNLNGSKGVKDNPYG